MNQTYALLDLQTITQRLRIGRTKLYMMMGKGEFPKPLKIGRSSRWVESDIDDWIARRRPQSEE